MLIIDCHCHFGAGDGLTGPWDTRASFRDFMRWTKEAGIHRTNIFAPFHSDYRLANRQVASLVMRHPKQFYGFAFVNPVRDAGRIFPMVKTAVQEYGFRGIKAHRHDGWLSREVCEVAKAFNLPVLYDVMGRTEIVELVASEYPTVNFIIPHLGSFSDDWRAQISFIPMLERHKNVYTDTSGVRRFDLLKRAYELVGSDKILFGSDGPWLHPAVELEKVFALNMPLSDQSKVLGGNFLKLTSEVVRQAERLPSHFAKPRPHHQLHEMEAKDPWLHGELAE